MSTILVISLVLIVVIFGASSMMQSYASAKQAEAVIETAQAAQMATFGNVVVILLLAIVVLAVLFAVMYLMVRGLPTSPRRGVLPHFSRSSVAGTPVAKSANRGIRPLDLTIKNSTTQPIMLSREDVARILDAMKALDESDEMDGYLYEYEEDAR